MPQRLIRGQSVSRRARHVAKLGVYIATEGDFRDHPKVADGASELLVKVFGAGMLSGRIVLGVASLPLGMPIEIELVFEIAAQLSES